MQKKNYAFVPKTYINKTGEMLGSTYTRIVGYITVQLLMTISLMFMSNEDTRKTGVKTTKS